MIDRRFHQGRAYINELKQCAVEPDVRQQDVVKKRVEGPQAQVDVTHLQ